MALSDPPKGPSLDKRTHAGFWTWTSSHCVLLARGSPDTDGPILQRKLAQECWIHCQKQIKADENLNSSLSGFCPKVKNQRHHTFKQTLPSFCLAITQA